jgi:hypothetical protein
MWSSPIVFKVAKRFQNRTLSPLALFILADKKTERVVSLVLQHLNVRAARTACMLVLMVAKTGLAVWISDWLGTTQGNNSAR